MSDFVSNLKNLRQQRGMSQDDLARLLGVARSTVSNYENGTRSPDKDTFIKIASCFQVSTDFLLGTDTIFTDNASHYKEVLNDINNLLKSAPLSEDKKKEIVNDLRDYFQWKMEQARHNLSEKGE